MEGFFGSEYGPEPGRAPSTKLRKQAAREGSRGAGIDEVAMRGREIEPNALDEPTSGYAAYHGTASLAVDWIPLVDSRLETENDALKLRRLDESRRVPRASD